MKALEGEAYRPARPSLQSCSCSRPHAEVHAQRTCASRVVCGSASCGYNKYGTYINSNHEKRALTVPNSASVEEC